MPGYLGALPSRPGSLSLLQNYHAQRMRSKTPLVQNHQLNHNLSFTSSRTAAGEQLPRTISKPRKKKGTKRDF
ncbi:hypothetical protein L484_001555 [Morus notabilis]|uniref:Uncharacterized protein n=1 Tax=Morus notabilis TaxID=981085 RepID=W9S041_9ROSA|nr:hypothetical protein L484_001555 [Morus notabilis]